MPIKPENRARYPKNWKEIRERILRRADHKCEQCGVGNHHIGYRDDAGQFVLTSYNGRLAMEWPSDLKPHPAHAKVLEIVLTIAHLDHTPENCGDDNLRAWCQKCHLSYDAEHHKVNAAATRRARLAVADLPGIEVAA